MKGYGSIVGLATYWLWEYVEYEWHKVLCEYSSTVQFLKMDWLFVDVFPYKASVTNINS